jgi:glycosyltransferase involved in cell wall biosynthesis
VQALATLPQDFKPRNLVCVSSRPFDAHERRLIRELGLESQVIQISASESELDWLYRNSKSLIFTSKYEGFGYPPVEGLASGKLSLVAKSSVAVEVLGNDYQGFFEPGNPADLRKKMISHAREQLEFKQFSIEDFGLAPSKMAELTAEFYRSVMSGRM